MDAMPLRASDEDRQPADVQLDVGMVHKAPQPEEDEGGDEMGVPGDQRG